MIKCEQIVLCATVTFAHDYEHILPIQPLLSLIPFLTSFFRRRVMDKVNGNIANPANWILATAPARLYIFRKMTSREL